MKIDLKQLAFMDSKVVEIVLQAEKDCEDILQFRISSLYRMNDAGVHGTLPCRGIDIQCKDDFVGKEVENRVNSKWVYDPSRPDRKVCMYHNAGYGWHLHFQSHPNTVKKL